MTARPRTRPQAVLAVACLAVFTVNVDTSIVNVALPTLARDLDASTRDLQWIVDSYLLVFAGLVLAGGSLSDRFGRRALLVGGLAVFGLGNTMAAFTETADALIAARAFTGIGAAAVFPTTLSILTQVFTERGARARAIGLWGASTGLAVAVGPISGGALLEHYWWGSTFLVKLPLALVVLLLALLWVPESKDPAAPRVDLPGLVLSAIALASLVFTIIEAPEQGWTSARTLVGFLLTAVLFSAFVRYEGRTPSPMLELRVFTDRRFTASSLAITVAFFALFGFVFLITQYFQFLRGYSPLETGVRILPVAVSVVVGSLVGTLLVVRLGNTVVVTAGLLSLSFAFAWASTASTATSYVEIAGQMVFLGGGLGLTSAPATEAIMGAVHDDKAGIGSAVNDATREVGGTLGVAVVGSVFASLYASPVAQAVGALPDETADVAGESFLAAVTVAGQLPDGPAQALRAAAEQGFFDGLAAGCLVSAGVSLAGAVVVALTLPGRPDAERSTLSRTVEPADSARAAR